MSNYQLTIQDLDFYAYHGCAEEEKRLGHRYLVDADLWMEAETHVTDQMEESVDYAEICSAIVTFATESQCWHLEFLAREICDLVLQHFSKVSRIDIHIRKPLPPAPIIVGAIGIRYSQSR